VVHLNGKEGELRMRRMSTGEHYDVEQQILDEKES
jgi:hypothetical protein